MTLLALSFHGMRLSALHSTWVDRAEQYQQQNRSFSPTKEPVSQVLQWRRELYMGGAFMLFDWESGRVMWQIAVDGVTGFCWHDGLLYLNMMRLDEIIGIDGFGRERHRFSHPHLNNIHTIVPTTRGFLLTSSGTDSIVELDRNGKLLYEWCALDYGFTHLKDGNARELDRTRDQRHVFYSTAYHTTHVNSARFIDPGEETIVATLFYQGEIVAIHRPSKTLQPLVRGLSNPHDLQPYRDGWIVSDTGNNQTLVLNNQWQIIHRISADFNWVQSSAPLHDGSIVVADTNNHRLVRVYNENDERSEIREFPPDWRIFQVTEVPSLYETFFQHPVISSLL